MRWEISYPTGESGATEAQLPSSEIVVQPDPDDPYALRLAHGPTGRRVIPVDLGFLNPRMRPPLYQLLSRFTPPVMFAPTVPESHAQPAHGHGARPATVEGLQVAPAAVAQDGGGADTVDQGADTVDQGAGTVGAGADTVAAAADAAQAHAAHAQPQPTISCRPRLTFAGSLVLARRRWSVPGTLLPQRRTDESAAEFFVRINRWRRESGIPETGYFRINPIPEPRPTPAGQPAPAQAEAPPEVVDEIPGYEGAAEAEAGAHEDEQEHEAEPAAGEAGWKRRATGEAHAGVARLLQAAVHGLRQPVAGGDAGAHRRGAQAVPGGVRGAPAGPRRPAAPRRRPVRHGAGGAARLPGRHRRSASRSRIGTGARRGIRALRRSLSS
jgi:hypothetical protein